MSCKVERFSTTEGAFLCASEPVSPGEELYVAEPFVYTAKETARGRVCEFCLMEKDRLLRCSQCKYAKYCSKQCQTKAWPDHKRECKCLDSVFTNDLVDTFRLLIRVIFKMMRNTHCASESLISVSEICEKMVMVKAMSFYHLILECMKAEIVSPSELPDELGLATLFSLVEVYRHPISNDQLTKAGVGLYPSMFLLQHSCEPNCCVAFMGSAAHLRAIRKICKGEQLTIAWFAPTVPTEVRQNLVRSLFFFDCHCRRCESNYLDEKMLAGDKQASDQTKDTIMLLRDLRSKKQWLEVLLVTETQLARNAGRVPDENIYQLEMLHSAMEACLVLSRPKEGLQYAYRALKTSRMYASDVNTETAGLLTEIASLEIEAGNESNAFKCLREAVKMYELFLGKSHPFVKRLASDLE